MVLPGTGLFGVIAGRHAFLPLFEAGKSGREDYD